MQAIVKYLREPLIQFLVLGAGIYALYGLFGAQDEGEQDYMIVIDESRLESMSSGWQSRMQRPPTQQELDGLINQYIREEILYREALEMGLGEDDPITRRRMAQKLEFLTRDIARLKEPESGELEAYFEQNMDKYRSPVRITFTHIYFDPDKRADTALSDAEAELTNLQALADVPDDARERGDRFMLQSYYPQKTALDIRKQLGSGFAESVFTLEPGRWHGPVLSGYGVHLVYVYAFAAAADPVFADVRERVYIDWQAGQQDSLNAQYYESLKSRYTIVVEEVPGVAAERQADAESTAELPTS